MIRPTRDHGASRHALGARGPAAPAQAARLLPALALALIGALVLWGVPLAAHADPEDGTASRPYQAAGPEVTGAESQAQAPLLLPGIHQDVFERGGSSSDEPVGTSKYYRIAVESGQRVHAAATIAAPPYADGIPEQSDSLGVGITFVTAGGDGCEDDGTDDVGQWMTGDGPVTSSAVSGVMGWDGCAGSELFLQITREGTRWGDKPLPVEIQVAIEPAGVGGGAPAVTEEIKDEGAAPVAPTEDAPLEAGTSSATAPEVDPGSYILELRPGDSALVRIPVQEGQRLRWRVETTAQPEDAGELDLHVSNAAREQVTVHGGSWRMSRDDRVAGGGMTTPVDRGNRSSDIPSVATAWLPGTHTVRLQRLQRPAGAEPTGDEPVTVVLTLEVEGEPSEDAPDGTVLELGTTTVEHGPLAALGIEASWARLATYAGAGALALLGLVTGVAGVLVLRLRRR